MRARAFHHVAVTTIGAITPYGAITGVGFDSQYGLRAGTIWILELDDPNGGHQP